MYYFGGKARIAKNLTAYLNQLRLPSQAYLEPFCGGLWVTSLITGPRLASDICLPLITLYQAIQDGWKPPSNLSEELYLKLKAEQDPHDPLTAFAGFGCSFSGKWFRGYARNSIGRNYAACAAKSLLRKMEKCQDVVFECKKYQEMEPENSLIYCDPPYAGVTGYGVGNGAAGAWDGREFWDLMRLWSRSEAKNQVFISEYSAPDDFECVLSLPTKTDIRTKSGKQSREEKLFKN